MIVVINIIRVSIFTIAIIITIVVVSHIKKSIIFLIKKFVALINIQTINKRKQKNFQNKTKIKVNIIYFWSIIKEI